MRLIDADAMREYWLENGENEYVYDTNYNHGRSFFHFVY